MIDRKILIDRANAYSRAHTPDTGYTRGAMLAVCTNDKLPAGTNLMVEFSLQFDGKETIDDHTIWDAVERQAQYGRDGDWRSMDGKMDCSSFWRNDYGCVTGIDIGGNTEAQWKVWKLLQVPWAQRRPLDLIYYNFKADEGRTVSHVAGYIGDGKILHTRSPARPLMVDVDTYAAADRVGVVRILTDAQYQELLFVPSASGGSGEPWPVAMHPVLKYRATLMNDAKHNYSLKPGDTHGWVYVKKLQELLTKRGFITAPDGIFGSATQLSVKRFQMLTGLYPDSICGPLTWGMLLK